MTKSGRFLHGESFKMSYDKDAVSAGGCGYILHLCKAGSIVTIFGFGRNIFGFV